jgi:PAS domain S-box-containing protein
MSKNSVKLGLMPPLTGLVGIYGTEISRAGLIACQEVNENGGVLGRPLELVIEDDGSLPESAVAAATKLLDEHRCAAIIGNLLSNSRIAVAYRVAEPRKVPYLNFSFYEGSILSRYFFHFAALPNQQIDRMIPYMRNKYGPRMFFAGNNYEWPRGSIDAAKRALLRSGGKVVGEEYCPIGVNADDMERLLDHIETVGPDVFVPYFAGADQVKLLTRFTERGLKKRMAVVMGHYDEIMASILPPSVREGFYSSNTYFMTVDTTENRNYLARLAALPGVSGIWPQGNGILTNFGEGTYVCVKAFAKAANEAGSLDPEALVDVLKTISLQAPQGTVHMDPVTHHAKVNTYLSRCGTDGVFNISVSFGAIDPALPERYNHQRISHQATLEDDIRLQARMLEQMSEAVLLVKSQDGSIIYSNAGAGKMLGYDKTEIAGQPIGRLDDPGETDPLRTSAGIIPALGQKGEWQGEIKVIRKDGEAIWCSVSVSTFTHPVYGEVWLWVANDISARKQVEEALRLSEERIRLVIEATNDGIWDWNPVTHEDYLSPRWKMILGYRDDELPNVDSTFFDLIHPDDRAAAAELVARHFEHGEPYRAEIRMRHKDGSYSWILSRGEAVRDAGGRPVRMVGTITDITERKRTESELVGHREQLEELVRIRTLALETAKDDAERANRAKSEFLSRMSHELRTPMNAILGFGQILEMESLTGNQKESVSEILHAGQHLLVLINELLDLSRIEAGRLDMLLEPVNLATVTNTALKLVSAIIKEQNISIHNRLEGSTHHYAVADNVRLRQVLVNLLSNAAKYNRPDGHIRIACDAPDSEHLRVSITDSGPGIPPEKQASLFKPFERLGAEFSEIEGTGIGLALSKQLIELMGGTIGMASTPGEGTTFWFDLPRVAPTRTASAEQREPIKSATRGAQKVLYIEDNPANVRLVKQLFSVYADMSLITATTGESGIDLARQHQPDLILLDIHLPGIDGYETLRRLRENPVTSTIPVIALSADAMTLDVKHGLAAGFQRYITKPFDIQELLDAVKQAMRTRVTQS